MVTDEHYKQGRVYPPLQDIRRVSTDIAIHLAEFAYKQGLAHHYPEPVDKRKFIESHQYSVEYDEYIPTLYDWPGHSTQL